MPPMGTLETPYGCYTLTALFLGLDLMISEQSRREDLMLTALVLLLLLSRSVKGSWLGYPLADHCHG